MSQAREEIRFSDRDRLKRGGASDDAKGKGLEVIPETYCEVVIVVVECVNGTFAPLEAFIRMKSTIGG